MFRRRLHSHSPDSLNNAFPWVSCHHHAHFLSITLPTQTPDETLKSSTIGEALRGVFRLEPRHGRKKVASLVRNKPMWINLHQKIVSFHLVSCTKAFARSQKPEARTELTRYQQLYMQLYHSRNRARTPAVHTLHDADWHTNL